MKIRIATISDVPAIVAIERTAPNASHWPVETYEKMFTNQVPVRKLLVIESEAMVVGFLVVRTLLDQQEIENIAIARTHLRRGFATRLLTDLIRSAKLDSIKEIILEVRESNHAARELYEKLGFLETGRRSNYFHNPDEPAINYLLVVQ